VMKKQILINICLFVLIIAFAVVSLICFNNVYDSNLYGTLKIYYRTQISDGNIDNLHWDYGRGEAPVVGGDKLNGLTAYIYNVSDEQCDVIIVSDRNVYGENVSVDHFNSDDVIRAQHPSSEQVYTLNLWKREVFEYSKLSSSNLSRSEKLFRYCNYAIALLCIVLISENIIYFVIKKKKQMSVKP
jgi:hypothetical protein